MLGDVRRLVAKIAEKFKRRFYGRTFRCPVCHLELAMVDADGNRVARYTLKDSKLGWLEVGDPVAVLTGEMMNEKLWFIDPPEGFSQDWLFGRNYFHAIRYYESKQYREAIVEFEGVESISPGYKDSTYLLGLCYANLHQYQKALKYLRRAVEEKPGSAEAWAALAYAYMNQGKLDEAVVAYKNLARLLPDQPKVWVDMGDLYTEMGNRQEAKQAYLKALEIDGNDEEAGYEINSSSP